ncbi:hypothetical protein BDA99DRAFT_259310 [Phascolomyces articulosus]|uniref:RNI-like protein n=1 Tax=Phascolomyces articulosus TaxID=60185 RepID=A0AAD5P811_9FUNG|nr:hypothetical protein BDA99DRAFT_259310 [Phascolomyces articulosus]
MAAVADTLQDLYLMTDHNTKSAFIPFFTILSTCHKLKTFAYIHDAETPIKSLNDIQDEIPTHELQLTSFNFTSHYLAYEVDAKLPAFLHQCPHLEQLSLSCIDGEQILYSIQQNCIKKLQKLVLHHFLCYQAKHTTANDDSLQLVTASILSTEECADIMIPYLAKSTDTLKTLYVNLRPVAVPTWDVLLTWNMPNLRHLTLSFEDLDDNEFIAALIHHLPLLEHVEFEECEYIDVFVLNALGQLLHLRSLSISGVIGAEEDSLADLFLTCAQRGVDGTLKSVTLDNCLDFIDTCDVLQSLADVESVQEIRIRECPLISEPTMNLFCDKLQQHPSIELLELNRIGAITDQTLASLSAVEHLTKLELYQLARITDEGVSDFRVANSKVELDIQGCGLLLDSTSIPTFHGI